MAYQNKLVVSNLVLCNLVAHFCTYFRTSMLPIKCGFQISEAYDIKSVKHSFVHTIKGLFDVTNYPICVTCNLVNVLTEFKIRSK